MGDPYGGSGRCRRDHTVSRVQVSVTRVGQIFGPKFLLYTERTPVCRLTPDWFEKDTVVRRRSGFPPTCVVFGRDPRVGERVVTVGRESEEWGRSLS